MPAKQDPNLGLNYGWDRRESGWGAGMDANLQKLGAIAQLAVLDRDLTAPPAAPADGDRYIVAAAATDAWAGHDGEIAIWSADAEAWLFYPPQVGWLCYIADEEVLSAYKAAGWSAGVAI